MKRVLLMICSLILVAACVFGLFACVTGITDVMNIMDYKLADEAMARDGIAQARDGIVQLKENEATYVDGCVQYVDGKQQIADNTQAYLEGKEKLATIEPLLPVINGYTDLRDSTVANLPGFDLLQEGVANLVTPLAGEIGLELPEGTTDLPKAIDDMVVDGKAQLAMYEDGVAQLAAAEPQLAMFADGEAQLADGMIQLQDQMTAGQLMKAGTQVTPSLKELLGVEGDDYFDLYQRDDNGNIKTSAVGVQLLDLDAVSKVCDTAEEYLEISGEDTTNELVGRIAANGMGAVAAVLGLIAGVFGIVAAITGGVKTGKTLGIISALFAIGANVAGIIVGYNDFAYGTRNVCDQATATEEELANMVVTPCGDLQFKALIILAIAAVLFVVVASIAKKAAKKNLAKKQAQANAAAASVAAKSVETYDNERLAKLEAENAELKAMVGALAEQTVKE